MVLAPISAKDVESRHHLAHRNPADLVTFKNDGDAIVLAEDLTCEVYFERMNMSGQSLSASEGRDAALRWRSGSENATISTARSIVEKFTGTGGIGEDFDAMQAQG